MRRARLLTQALLISGALNICLIATFAYFAFKGKESSLSFELKPIETSKNAAAFATNEQVLRAYSLLSFQDLLLRLEEKEAIEAGYAKRDLALATLVAFHHFNLEKALGGNFYQQRKITFKNEGGQETIDLNVFPGLTDDHYLAICKYAKTEKWPYTSKGLFFEMKRAKTGYDPSLLEAFYFTPEFHTVATLFGRSGVSVERETLIALLTSGNWEILEHFTKEQREAQDLSLQRTVSFLIDYLHQRSPLAAKLLLEADLEFALKRLDDPHVLLVLELLAEKSTSVEAFTKGLLVSLRSDAVRKKAAGKLLAFSGESLPEPYSHEKMLARFFPAAPVKQAVSVQKTRRTHTVQEGESLWKIAKKYGITIDALKEANRLDTERLRPGKELQLP